VNAFSTIKLSNPATNLKFGFDYFLITRQDSKINSNARQLLKFKPSYSFEAIDNLTVSVGANIAYQNEPIYSSSSFNFFPTASATYKLNNSLSLVGNLTGDIDKVNLQTVTQENFWLNSNQQLTNTKRSYQFDAGIYGKAASNLAFQSGVSFSSLKGLYYFKNDLANRAKFDLEYETGSTNKTNLYGAISFNKSENFSLNFKADYFSYSRESGLEAYFLPTYKLNMNLTYNLFKKLIFSPNFTTLGGMKAYDNEKKLVTELSPAIDLSIKTEYIASKRVYIYLQLNNLLSNNYQVYLNYPVRGFQAMGGVSYTF
jgi:hypothetical protein